MSAAFPLFASADHAFVINRGIHHSKRGEGGGGGSACDNNNNSNNNIYSFQGSDHVLSWSSVKLVRHQSHDVETCPICLENDFVCPRITKCGHVYCCICLIRHIQCTAWNTSNNNNNNHDDYTTAMGAVKCPCCNESLHLTDVRPVEFVTVTLPKAAATATTIITTTTDANSKTKHFTKSPSQQQQQQRPTHVGRGNTMKFVKLHRSKACFSPYLPRLDCPRRGSPHALPLQHPSDPDALYSRFTYVDPNALKARLHSDWCALKAIPADDKLNNDDDDMFRACRKLALELVETEIQTALREFALEEEMQQRFNKPSAGIYQKHPPQLIYHPPPPQPSSPVSQGDGGQGPPQLHSSSEHEGQPLEEEEAAATRHRSASLESEQSQSMHDYSGNVSHDSIEEIITASANQKRDRTTSVGSESSWHAASVEALHVYDPTSSPRQKRRGNRSSSSSWATHGSMYLGDDENIFFQAEDGLLCFLSAFNMQCLRSEFTTSLTAENEGEELPPSLTQQQHQHYDQGKNSNNQQPNMGPRKKEPLPDTVQGRVLEVEHVILTKQTRQRLRFLSHLPLGTPITLVEIALAGLSPATKRLHAKEFAQRRNARDKKSRAEQRADDRAQRRHDARMVEMLAYVVPDVNRTFRSQHIDVTSDAFGPALVALSPPRTLTAGAENSNHSSSNTNHSTTQLLQQRPPSSSSGPSPRPTVSFSSIAKKAQTKEAAKTRQQQQQKQRQQRLSQNHFPALGSARDFPALGSVASSSSSAGGKAWSSSSWSPKKATPSGRGKILGTTTSTTSRLTNLGPGN